MKYGYKVIESESPTMEVGFKFVTGNKLHDDRKKSKIVELSDVEGRDYKLELFEIYTDLAWENYKKNVGVINNGKTS